jgi:hypothetical protein
VNMHLEDVWVIVATQDDDWSVGIGPFRTEATALRWLDQNHEWGIDWQILPFDEALPLLNEDLQCPEIFNVEFE